MATVASLEGPDVQAAGDVDQAPAGMIDGRPLVVSGRWVKIAGLKDEDLIEGEVVGDPVAFAARVRASGVKADVFTFARKLDEPTGEVRLHREWDNLAVIQVTSFTDWWDKRVESSVRRAVRKAAKVGVVTKVVQFDEQLVEGIVDIYNETPVRQGRAFWHYQKSIDAVRRENSTYLDRSTFIGVYLGDELIGFLRMIHVDRVASIVQILSKMGHFDKRPTNALIAKAVEVCEQRGIGHLVYCSYVYNDTKNSLTEFKKRNGFEQILVPRYYVPLTLKGRLALRLGLHRPLASHIPAPVLSRLRRIRKRLNEGKSGTAPAPPSRDGEVA
jgi:hypothetical protein